MTNQPLKDKITETAKEGVAAAVSYGREAGHAIASEVSDRASETMETVRDAAAAKAEDARESLANTGDRLAQSLQDNADDASGLQARVLSGLASGVSSATDKLRNNSLSDVGSQIRRYAHDNPGVFAAAAAIAGFALARFLMSSSHTASGSGQNTHDGPRS